MILPHVEIRWVNGVSVRRLDLYQFKGQELLKKKIAKSWTTNSPKSCFLFVFKWDNTEESANVAEEIVPGNCLHCILLVCLFVFFPFMSWELLHIVRGLFGSNFCTYINKLKKIHFLFWINETLVDFLQCNCMKSSFENEIETFMNALQYMTHNVWVMYWHISNVFTTFFVGNGMLLYVKMENKSENGCQCSTFDLNSGEGLL